MIRWYRLDGHTPVLCRTRDEMFSEHERRERGIGSDDDPWRVGRTPVLDAAYVSTVFLGLDHSWDDGPPILFETMVFGMPEDHPLNEWTERCATWEQAERQHESIVEMVTAYVQGELERLKPS